METLSVDQLVGQVLGNYRIERLLGQGRLNTIYLARNLTEQRHDALTFYNIPERFSREARTYFLSRFRKEATAITSLDHPHILPIYDHGDLAGNPYLVTPYMTHGSLADLLKQQGKYDHDSILPILEQVVSGLSYAHNNGFIHGTLRPSTIVVCEENDLRIAGFGLMHMLQLSGIEPAEQKSTPYIHLLSIAETFLVTPEYVAPEVAQGQSIDARSDIYTLGCILFELLSGQPPFTGKDPLEIVQKHITKVAPSLHAQNPEVPIALASVVNQALDRNPARRFQHVLELLEAFRQASRGAAGNATLGIKRQTKALKNNDSLQDTSHENYVTNKWQLVPPIVTSKHSTRQLVPPIGTSKKHTTVQVPEQEAISGMPAQPGNTDSWRAASPIAPDHTLIVTSGRMPAITGNTRQTGNTSSILEQEAILEMQTWSSNTSARRAMPSVAPKQSPTEISSLTPVISAYTPQVEKTPSISEQTLNRDLLNHPPLRHQEMTSPTKQEQPARIESASPPSSNGEDPSSLAKDYAWWSISGIVSPPEPPPAKQKQPDHPEVPREPLHLANADMEKWGNNPSSANALATKSAPAPRKVKRRNAPAPRKIKRRNAIAMLATGAVAVGVAALSLNKLPHLFESTPNQTSPKDAPAQPGHANLIFGHTTMAMNSAESFTNPADGQSSLLIHLPDKRFVAYEKACTHSQVLVAYDPARKLLVCPAHGAMFDPADGGKAVLGPGGQPGSVLQPLASVKISIHADGTIRPM